MQLMNVDLRALQTMTGGMDPFAGQCAQPLLGLSDPFKNKLNDEKAVETESMLEREKSSQ